MTAPIRILVVENDENLSSILREYFAIEGYQVSVAENGPQALELCNKERPDLILLDIGLGEMSGFEVFRQLRKMRTGTVPTIFMTGQQEKDVLMEGLQLGAEDFVFKPFDPQEIVLRVENALKRASRQRNANPYTGLPNSKASAEFLAAVKQQSDRQAIVLWIENLDKIGPTGALVRARLLRALGKWLAEALDAVGEPIDFLGHHSPDRFLVICSPDRTTELYEKANALFEINLPDYAPDPSDAPDTPPLSLQHNIL